MESITIAEVVTATGGILLQGDETTKITSVEQDSRKITQGALFVPFVGEKVDAHKFIPQVLSAGAVCTFTVYKEKEREEKGAYIYVKDPLTALQKLAAYYRSKFTLPIIGVTGSVGKTSTKEMISTVLEAKYQVLKTEGNLNSQIGVALMMMRLEKKYDVAVIEMGISQFDEMDRLVEMVRPDMAVLTNVGVSHIGNLKSRENICREKGKIITKMPKQGRFFICGNGDMKELTKKAIPVQKITQELKVSYYGTENNCDYEATEICMKDGMTEFLYSNGQEKKKISLPVMGIHNVNNALVALAIGEQFHISIEEAKEALLQYQPFRMRGELKEGNDIRVIDDTYNASPDSIRSSLDVLLSYENANRKIAVLADVLELGDMSGKLHSEIGEFINERRQEGRKIDFVITVGKEAEAIHKAITTTPSLHFPTREEAIKYISDSRECGDLYLVKGSRGMQMDLLVNAILM